MTERAPPCPVEALTWEQAAVRCSCSLDTLRKHYDGPVSYIGNAPRIASHHLREWLDKCAKTGTTNPWDGLTNAEGASLQEREKGQAA